jgi:UDP-glucose 4-epimerase
MILVTGDRGYIGSHLAKVAPFDYQRVDLKSGRNFALLDESWSVVVHLAAYVSVIDSINDPAKYLENNFFALRRFLSTNRVDRFIFASTGGAIYGDNPCAKEEDARWEKCLSPYAQSKFLAEMLIREMCPNHVILRLGNVYGGDDSIRGEAAVHAHFKSDNPIIVYDGRQTRDFVHIDFVCQAVVRAVSGSMTGTFNIGSGIPCLVSKLAHKFAEERGVQIVYKPHRKGEVYNITLDISKAVDAGLL